MTTNIARGTVFVTLRTWLNEYPLCDHEPEYQANIEEADDATVHCYLLERFVWSTSSCCPHVDCDFIVPWRDNTILGIVGEPRANANIIHESSDEKAIQMPCKRVCKVQSILPLPFSR